MQEGDSQIQSGAHWLISLGKTGLENLGSSWMPDTCRNSNSNERIVLLFLECLYFAFKYSSDRKVFLCVFNSHTVLGFKYAFKYMFSFEYHNKLWGVGKFCVVSTLM